MTTVLAALDASAAARPVLESALGIGELTSAVVEAVHVSDGAPETLASLTERCGVPLRLLHGPVDTALLDAIAEPAVAVAVLGARSTAGGRRPPGRTALRIMEQATTPVVVVPPEACGPCPRPFRRLLVPLDGTVSSSLPVMLQLVPLIATDIEIVVLHVFNADTLPRVLDHPSRDLSVLGDEFLARHCPPGTQIELRTGPTATRIVEMVSETSVDLVVLSWSQASSEGGAAIVREVLDRSIVPLLLLPSRNTRDGDLWRHTSPAAHDESRPRSTQQVTEASGPG